MPLPFVDLGHAGPNYMPAFRWPLDEVSGNFRDIGGNGQSRQIGVANGTILRNGATPPGWASGCVQMSTGGWINIWGALTQYLLWQYGYAISCWVRRTVDISGANNFHVIAAASPWAINMMVGAHSTIPYSSANTFSYGWQNTNGNWENVVDNQPLPLNQWWFYMATWDGYRMGIERNGFDVASGSGLPAFPQVPTGLAIGCHPDGASWRATGLQIADFRIYPYRLVEGEARAIYQSYSTPPAYPWIRSQEPHQLILYLPGDQAGGVRNIRDANGNPVGGNFGGGSPQQPGPYPGQYSFALNGSSEYLAAKGSNALNNVTNVWTLAAWVYPTAATTTTYRGIITKNHTQGGNCLPEIGYGGGAGDPVPGGSSNRFNAALWNGTAWGGVADTVDAPVNTWTHIAGTCDGTTIRLYRNGALVSSAAAPAAPAATANDWLIGKRWDGTGYFPGRLSDVRVYNQALSPEAVKGIYDRAAGIARPWVPLGVVT